MKIVVLDKKIARIGGNIHGIRFSDNFAYASYGTITKLYSHHRLLKVIDAKLRYVLRVETNGELSSIKQNTDAFASLLTQNNSTNFYAHEVKEKIHRYGFVLYYAYLSNKIDNKEQITGIYVWVDSKQVTQTFLELNPYIIHYRISDIMEIMLRTKYEN